MRAKTLLLAFPFLVAASLPCRASGDAAPAPSAAMKPAPGGAMKTEDVTPRSDDMAPPEDNRRTMALSLEQAIEMALAHDLDIQSSRLSLQIAAQGEPQARGAFDPVLNGYYQHSRSVRPTGSALDSGPGQSTSEQLTDSYQTTISQKLYYGATYSAGLTAVRSQTNSVFSTLNPSLSASMLLKYTQPLLRGFGRDSNRRLLNEAINSLQISRSGLETRARDTIRDTIRAYWELVFTNENLKVQKASLGLAQELLRKNRIMVEVGTLAPLEIATAEASVADRQYLIITAQAAIGTAEDALRILMGVEPDSPSWALRLVPTDEAEFHAAYVDADEALSVALTQRSELEAAQLAIANANLDEAAAKDARLPQLDLDLTYTGAGLDGGHFVDTDPLVDSDGDGNPTNDQDAFLQGSLTDSFQQVKALDFKSWTAALTYTQPLRNRAANASLFISHLTLEERKLDMEKLRQTITLEVRKALRDVESARERIGAAGSARTLQDKKLQAEIKKFENGLSTNFEVLQFQNDLEASESNQLRSTIDYLQALAELKRSRGTLLRDYDLSLSP